MNNKIIIIVLILAMFALVSADNGEKIGNPHIDDDTQIEVSVYPDINITVESVIKKEELNCNMTALIVDDDIGNSTVVTRELVSTFFCENGNVLFYEKRCYNNVNNQEIDDIVQYWMTPTGDFIKVYIDENLNGNPTIKINDLVIMVNVIDLN